MKGQDGTTPMAHCPGWKQANAFGDFCRKVALAYPVQADAAKIAYCDKNFLDETCDCLKAGVIGTKQKGCEASEPKAKNVGDRTAFCAQTTGSSNAISQLLAKNRANWYNYCQADGANADYTLKPAFVWSADQTKCTKDAKDALPGCASTPTRARRWSSRTTSAPTSFPSRGSRVRRQETGPATCSRTSTCRTGAETCRKTERSA